MEHFGVLCISARPGCSKPIKLTRISEKFDQFQFCNFAVRFLYLYF